MNETQQGWFAGQQADEEISDILRVTALVYFLSKAW